MSRIALKFFWNPCDLTYLVIEKFGDEVNGLFMVIGGWEDDS